MKITRIDLGRTIEVRMTALDFSNTCPKCSVYILPESRLPEHIKNCKSTAIKDAAKAMADRIDAEIMEQVMKEPRAGQSGGMKIIEDPR